MLSPLGGSGSAVVTWKVKQTGPPSSVVPIGSTSGGAVENAVGVGWMTHVGKGGVIPWVDPWYVVMTCGWIVPMTTPVSESPEGCGASALGRMWVGSTALTESFVGPELGTSKETSTLIPVWDGSGTGCKASVSAEVCGSSGEVAREAPASAEGSGAASRGLFSVASGVFDCGVSCEDLPLVVVSSDELDSLDSDDLGESSLSFRQTCFIIKQCHKSTNFCYTVGKCSSKAVYLLTGLAVTRVTMRTAQRVAPRTAIAVLPVFAETN